MIDILTTITIGLIPGLIVVDWVIRGRRHASTRFWRLRATLVTIATFYLAGFVAVFWTLRLLKLDDDPNPRDRHRQSC